MGKLTSSAIFYRRGIPNSYVGFGQVTLNNFQIGNTNISNFNPNIKPTPPKK
jgi:hypothetical protein